MCGDLLMHAQPISAVPSIIHMPVLNPVADPGHLVGGGDLLGG